MDFEQLLLFIPKRVCQWEQQDVTNWLKFINLSKLNPLFVKHKCRGQRLQQIDSDFIRYKLNVTSNIVTKKLENWIFIGFPSYDSFLANTHLTIDEQFQNQRYKFNDFFGAQTLKKQNETEDEESSKELTQIQESTIPKTLDRVLTASKQKKIQKNTLLIYEVNSHHKTTFYEFNQRGGFIGRSPKNQIFIMDHQVGLYQCEIIFSRQQNCYYLNHLERNCATWKKVKSKMEVQNKMVVEMGYNSFMFEPRRDQMFLTIVEGDNSGDTFRVHAESQRVTFGRRNQCDISFPLDTTISGIHATIYNERGVWYFEDMESTNGSWLKLYGLECISEGFQFKIGNLLHSYECRIKNGDKIQSNQTQKKMNRSFKHDKCEKCGNEQKNSYLRPCYHNLYCYECSKTEETCPICYGEISQIVKIYRI